MTVFATFHFLHTLLMDPMSNITLGWKCSLETNTMAYWTCLEIRKKLKCCKYIPVTVFIMLQFLHY